MTIRAKLYAAIVLTILGPLATTAVALHGMSQMGDRFDEVRQRAEREAVARELKFLVTDVNGWQTAYGYAGGDLRGRFVASAPELREELDLADETLTDEREQQLLSQLNRRVRVIHGARRDRLPPAPGGPGRSRSGTSSSGPNSTASRRWRRRPSSWPRHEADQAAATETAFDEARDDARRRLIAVALGAGVVVILLLVTANDIAKMALEGERRTRERTEPEPKRDQAS